MNPPGDRIVVIGDALLDRDVEGDACRLSPDAPVPVLDEHTRRARPGGAALTASLAALAGDPVTLVTALGADEAGEELRALLDRFGVQVIAAASAGTTPEKIRFLAGSRPLLRVDRGGLPAPIGALPGRAVAALRDAAVVVVSDYGRGLTGNAEARSTLQRRHRPTVWDPHPRGSQPVPGATLVTPNLAELRAAFLSPAPLATPTSRRAHQSLRAVADATAAARQAWNVQAVATTLGEAGALLVAGDGPPLAVPAEAVQGGDPCGAGDRFVAAVASRLLRGGLLSEAITDAVAAAGRFVAAGGAGSVMAASQIPAESPPEPLGAEELARRFRSQGGTVVVAGGCFDLLHAGHVSLLESARRLGDCLIVAVNSDASVRRLKGRGRPVIAQSDRAALLAALACVDTVVVFDDDSPVELLQRIRPHVFVKGGDYSSESLPEAAVLAAWGGQAVTVPYLSGRSTTGLLQLASGIR
jgi:rfaE bifunctional protein nucleotidyltransferase chain/domain/rfaE bifunctional protein kinase chain/domain